MLRIPYYGRLSSFYFLYYAMLGVLVPYWSLFLKHRQFSAAEIGLLLAIPHITKLGAPNLWGWLADVTGRRLLVIRTGNFFAALIFPLVFITYGFWPMIAVLAGFSFFWNAVMAQCEALTLETLGEQSHRYSLIRLWGSVGFVGTVLALGIAVEKQGVQVVPATMGVVLFGLWLASLLLPNPNKHSSTQATKETVPFLPYLRQAAVVAFFVAGLLMQLAHGPFYAFYTLHLDAHNISGDWIGVLWSVGVIAEILLFMLMSRLLIRFSIKSLLVVSLLLSVLRWTMIGSGETHLAWLAVAQTLHAFSFACYHASAMAWLHDYFPQALAGRAQAVYASFSLGAGWALGAVMSGLLWEAMDVKIFYLAAISSAVAAVLLITYLPRYLYEPACW